MASSPESSQPESSLSTTSVSLPNEEPRVSLGLIASAWSLGVILLGYSIARCSIYYSRFNAQQSFEQESLIQQQRLILFLRSPLVSSGHLSLPMSIAYSQRASSIATVQHYISQHQDAILESQRITTLSSLRLASTPSETGPLTTPSHLNSESLFATVSPTTPLPNLTTPIINTTTSAASIQQYNPFIELIPFSNQSTGNLTVVDQLRLLERGMLTRGHIMLLLRQLFASPSLSSLGLIISDWHIHEVLDDFCDIAFVEWIPMHFVQDICESILIQVLEQHDKQYLSSSDCSNMYSNIHSPYSPNGIGGDIDDLVFPPQSAISLVSPSQYRQYQQPASDAQHMNEHKHMSSFQTPAHVGNTSRKHPLMHSDPFGNGADYSSHEFQNQNPYPWHIEPTQRPYGPISEAMDEMNNSTNDTNHHTPAPWQRQQPQPPSSSSRLNQDQYQPIVLPIPSQDKRINVEKNNESAHQHQHTKGGAIIGSESEPLGPHAIIPLPAIAVAEHPVSGDQSRSLSPSSFSNPVQQRSASDF